MPDLTDPAPTFVRWAIPEQHGQAATGVLRDVRIDLEGPLGTAFYQDDYPGFRESWFTPPLAASGMIELASAAGNTFTLTTHGTLLTNPIIQLGSLGSVLTITSPPTVTLTRLSGDDEYFQVAGNTVSGRGRSLTTLPDGVLTTDSNGSVQLTGTFTHITFTLAPRPTDDFTAEGVYFQIGGQLPLDDALPALLGPVRLEYRYTDSDLLVRVFPDEWAIDSFEEGSTARELEHVARFWSRRAEAGDDRGQALAAWHDLASHVGPGRAVHLARTHRDRPAAADPAGDKDSTWTQPARARLLPDAFTLLGWAGGQVVLNVTGKPVPADLAVGPDPGTPDADQFTSDGDGLHVPAPLKWLVDFGSAVAAGMAFQVPLDDTLRAGLDRMIVLGMRVRDPATSQADLETLLAHQAGSQASFRLLAQGTPTNNTGQAPSPPGPGEESAATFAALDSPMPVVAASDWAAKADGQWLAELLGVAPSALAAVPGAATRDLAEARAMNVALWPATWGYHLGAMLNPVFGTAAVDATRTFFTKYVSGRGPAPAFRIGHQPYGLLVTTAFSRMRWADDDPDAAHRRVLSGILATATQDWSALAAKVAFLGADGDPHQLLLDILGLHPTSAEFYQRFAQSVEDYYNRQNLDGAGEAVLTLLAQIQAQQQIRGLLTRLGYPATARDPDVMFRLFTERQHPMRGPLVDDRPRSETDPVRAYTDDGRNYLAWLVTGMTSSLDTVRLESGFTGNSPPTAVLYLLLRHAVLNAYAETALRLTASAHNLGEAGLLLARREPPFIHISQRTTVTESRYGTLYAPDAAVTGDPERLLADHVTSLIRPSPATPAQAAAPATPAPAAQHLTEQVAAISALAELPTARLERALVEHLDCCTYRLDAWRLGLASEKLFALRYPDDGTPDDGTPAPPAVTGVHIGAFGWLEDVRPRATVPAPVTLTGDLAQVFTPPGASPLVRDDSNQGYIHAPSPTHASTAALLRAGYLANASPGNPGTLAVNLSSGRVRTALTFLDGLRAGQSLGALLGYQLVRDLHDGYAIAETDKFIGVLRQAFPLVAGKLSTTPAGTPIDSLEARNVVDGLALIRQVTRTGIAHYPFGMPGLPAPTPDQAAAINTAVQRLIEIQDALADLSVAEGVHQAVLGNPDRATAGMDAYTTTGNPPDPEVVSTPSGGPRLTQRIGLHLPAGQPPGTSPVPGLAMTPRGSADPAVDRWLADLLPVPDNVVCQVSWADPVTNAAHTQVVSQFDLGLQPIDLLWALRPDDQAAMTDLDDRIIGHVLQAQNLRADTGLRIGSTGQVTGKITFFELSPLVASLRSMLLAARPARPADYAVPAAGGTFDRHSDDQVDLPRTRPQAVRDALNALLTLVSAFPGDLDALRTDPRTWGPQLLSEVDKFLTRYAQLAVTASGLGLVRSGWGELAMWRHGQFDDLLAAVRAVADRMTTSLAAASDNIAQYDNLPPDASDDQRLTVLRQAERLLSASPATAQPGTPEQLRAAVGNLRSAFSNALSPLTALAGTTRSTLSDLLADVAALPSLTSFDPDGLDLTPAAAAVGAFADDLLARAQDLQDELTQRLATVDTALTTYDQATDGPGRVAAATAAIRAALGPDALATSEFSVPADLGQAWRQALAASSDGQLTQHLNRDFPVDDWLHGVVRVRPQVARCERIVLLANAIARGEPDLVPIQLPYQAGEPWLGLEIPSSFMPAGDRLLYTAHYATPFDPGGEQCALLLDEWTEMIPATTATTGIAAHYARPGTQPPQAMLLVVPPGRTGGWQWDDLVAAAGETLDLIRVRAVEPGHIDGTGWSQLLPATVLSAPARPISIGTDLSVNNENVPTSGPFRPAGG